MRACCVAPLLLLLLLLLLQGGRPELSASPPPAPSSRSGLEPCPGTPERVRFVAHTFQHLLLWAPPAADRKPGPSLRYDVQYKRYGNHSWTPVGRCSALASLACDLTAETADPSGRYFARVRARHPRQHSPSCWTPSRPFAPHEATLQLWNVSLTLSGNILRVSLELPVHRGKQATVAYQALHPSGPWGQVRVFVRRVSSNEQYVLVGTNRTFDLPPLVWGEQYCVSMEPHLPSRPNPTKRTEEHCISTPVLKDNTKARAIVSVALLSLLGLSAAATARVCAYLKKPMKSPSVLESFQKPQSPSPWPLGMRGVDLCLEVESTHPISLGLLKDHDHPANSIQPSSGAGWLIPGQGADCLPEALTSSHTDSAQLKGLSDICSSDSDSGICLQDPFGTHSLLLERLEHKGPLLRTVLGDCGQEVEDHLLQQMDSEEEPKQGELNQAQLLGNQRQSGPAQEALGSSSCPSSSESIAPSQQALASGYLKQTPAATPSTLGLRSLACHGPLHFLPSMGPGGLESLPCLPEFPKCLLVPRSLFPPTPSGTPTCSSVRTSPGAGCEEMLQRHI